MYFLRGSLPWQGLKAATNKQKYEKIGEKKQTTPIKDLCEGYPGLLILQVSSQCSSNFRTEEFGIYLNYVRKLGFEETPDYDFLRDLFSKVMKNNNDLDDGIFDWNLLNGTTFIASGNLLINLSSNYTGGKGWEASQVGEVSISEMRGFHRVAQGQSQVLAQIQNAAVTPAPQDRRKDMERRRDTDWRRTSQTGGVNPPSPALVRHGSKRRVPNALTPGAGNAPGGTATPLSAAAQINVPISTPQNRSNNVGAQQHPYANAATGEYGWDAGEEPYGSQAAYGRASPMVSTVGAAPPAISTVRAHGNEAGVSRGEDYRQQQDDDPPQPKSSIWRILTCRCG